MSFNPMISIVIPVYNGSNYLRQSIDSALAQTYANVEVIVINDGSTDNGKTEAIARSYGDKIRYFNKENGGVATALNLGIHHMKGAYFSWLSHDDVYLPHKLEAQVKFMQEYELENCILYSNYSIIDKDDQVLSISKLPFVPSKNMFNYLYLRRAVHGCTMLIPRAALIDAGCFDVTKETCNDYTLWFKLCLVHDFVLIPENLIQVRRHDEQGCLEQGHRNEARQTLKEYLPELLVHSLAPNSPMTREQSDKITLREAMLVHMKADLIGCGIDVMCMAFVRLSSWKDKFEFIKMLLVGLVYYFDRRSVSWLKPFWNLLKPKLKPYEFEFLKNNRCDFTHIYETNVFASLESASGSGSTLFQTRILRRELPKLLQEYGIKSLLDAPCGDCNWMKECNFCDVQYIGGDIVKELATRNDMLYGNDERSFYHLDIINDELPNVDAILCRDCLVHLPEDDIFAFLRNLKKSNIKWLLTTTNPGLKENIPFINIGWRPIDLCKAPFNLPQPQAIIDEKNTEDKGDFGNKYLALWRVADINVS